MALHDLLQAYWQLADDTVDTVLHRLCAQLLCTDAAVLVLCPVPSSCTVTHARHHLQQLYHTFLTPSPPSSQLGPRLRRICSPQLTVTH